MSSRKKGELRRAQQKKFKNDAKKAKLSIITETRTEIVTIYQLDLDCLANIFSYLSPLDRLEVKQVCKKWKEAVDMSWYNVKKIDTEDLPISINKRDATLKKLLINCSQYLTHLTIDLKDIWMADIFKNGFENIVYFDVKLSCEYWSPFRDIIQSMSKLKCLKAAVTSKSAFGIFNQLLRQLPVDIEEIHLVASNLDKKRKEAPMLDKFSNLRCLTLKFFLLKTSTIDSILLKKDTLIHLDLTDSKLPLECPILFAKLVNLEHLDLRGLVDKYLHYNMLSKIVHNCPKLKYFCVGSHHYYNNFAGRRIFRELKYLKNLEHLVLPPVDEASDDDDDDLMADFVDNCKKLKHLNVGKGLGFSTLDIEKLTRLNNLEYLNLYWTIVDSKSITNITSNCLELKQLKIDIKQLPGTVIEKLTNLKKLETLDFSCCNDITGDLLSKFSINCKNLVELDLSWCCNVTEACLIQFGKLKYLKKLVLDGIENVPNAVFDYFHGLEKLSCSNCPSVTDEGIIKVINNCLYLSHLSVEGTGITVDTLVHAGNRQFGYKILSIIVDKCVQRDYINLHAKASRYLEINKHRF